MMRKVLTARHALPLACSGLLLVVALTVAVRTTTRVSENSGWVNQGYYVISEIRRTVSLLKDAEAELLGYLISGQDGYAQSFEATARRTRAALDELAASVANDAPQYNRAKHLDDVVEGRLRRLRDAARLRRPGGTDAARETLFAESALRFMSEIHQIEQEMAAAEMASLDVRRERMHATLRTANVTVVAAGALALAMALNTFLVMRRALRAISREAELLRAKELAERADREKSEFLANMSHEIRTPLNAVLGFTDLLRGLSTNAKQRQYVEAITTSGRALLSLINDILDLSKIEAGRLEITLKPTSVRSLLDGIQTIFAQQAAERGLTLALEIDPGIPPSLLFDATRLRQILFNVVGNALKFTPQGSITVRAWSRLTKDDETTVTLHLEVIDTGIGIAPADQELIFEPFRQVKSAAAPNVSGTGLGLSITRRLVQVLDGLIEIDSAPGRGTTLRFAFSNVPISAARADDETLPPQDEDLNTVRASLILVADDVPLNCELLDDYFANTHHRVLHAATGRTAIAMARHHRPDIILMDIRMPDLDGCMARKLIKEDTELAAIPVVAVTASSMVTEEEELRARFDGYIRKPFTRAALVRELTRLLPEDTAPRPARDGALRDHSHEIALPVDTTAWEELAAHLQSLENNTLPALARSMGFHEMEDFAGSVLAAAERARCGFVADYARRLLADVNQFEIGRQEQSLRAFPALIERLDSLLALRA